MEIAWAIVGVLVPALIGIGFSVLGYSEPGFYLARACFWLSAILLGVMQMIWQVQTQRPAVFRLAAAVSAWILIGVGLPELLRWINGREGAFKLAMVSSLELKARVQETLEAPKTSLPPKPLTDSPFDLTVPRWQLKNDPIALTLHDLFLTDFDSVQQKATGAVFLDNAQSVSVQYTIATELALRSKFLIFYIPASDKTAYLCEVIAKQYHFILDKAPQLMIEQKGVGDSGTTSTKEAVFTKRIYIYHETYLPSETVLEIINQFKNEGVSVILRSTDYRSTKSLEARVAIHPKSGS